MIGVLEIAFIWIFLSFSTAKTVTSKVVVLSTVNIQINRYMFLSRDVSTVNLSVNLSAKSSLVLATVVITAKNCRGFEFNH